ncbi:hypothetical protein ACVJMY_003008 [Bradyrhizobium diazoefficiens]
MTWRTRRNISPKLGSPPKSFAQDQGVGEQPDQTLALDLVAVGDQRSGRDILMRGVTE